MPRRKNTKPTLIYFLLDARPKKLAAGWPMGEPFYCGKTVDSAEARLSSHRFDARKWPNRRISKRIAECGEHVRAQVMETVPLDADWIAREKRWIELLRFSFPGGTNVSDGGDGSPGYVHTEESRAKMRAKSRTRIRRRYALEGLAKRSVAMKASWARRLACQSQTVSP
jgi:hypothetical protein